MIALLAVVIRSRGTKEERMGWRLEIALVTLAIPKDSGTGVAGSARGAGVTDGWE